MPHIYKAPTAQKSDIFTHVTSPDQRNILPARCVCWGKTFSFHRPLLGYSRRRQFDCAYRLVDPVNRGHYLAIIPDGLCKEGNLPPDRWGKITEHDPSFVVFVALAPNLLQKALGETTKLKTIVAVIWQASVGAISISGLMLCERICLDEDADYSCILLFFA
jgi:hypothetical protein